MFGFMTILVTVVVLNRASLGTAVAAATILTVALVTTAHVPSDVGMFDVLVLSSKVSFCRSKSCMVNKIVEMHAVFYEGSKRWNKCRKRLFSCEGIL